MVMAMVSGDNYKKKKKSPGLGSSGSANEKKKKSMKIKYRPSSSRYQTEKSVRFWGELKDMRKLSRNDEAFRLSWETISDIIRIINRRKTPAPKKYMRWDEYAISFYLKMCTCFGVDYQNLEAASHDGDSSSTKEMSSKEQEEPMVCTQPSTKEMSCEKLREEAERMEHAQPPTSEMSYEERLKEVEHTHTVGNNIYLKEPFELGFYSAGTSPDRIPYHLYLLVKEAVDIMKRLNNTYDQLLTVEKKIRFFSTYFYSHLPTGWNYDRGNASSLIAGYDTKGGHKYLMAGFTPFTDWNDGLAFDPETYMTAPDIVDIMCLIHSRKTPSFWKMTWHEIFFYCRLCSCFGIDYHHLEAASEDDVCLMKVGRNT